MLCVADAVDVVLVPVPLPPTVLVVIFELPLVFEPLPVLVGEPDAADELEEPPPPAEIPETEIVFHVTDVSGFVWSYAR